MLERVRKKKGAKEEKKYSRYAGLSGTEVSKKKKDVSFGCLPSDPLSQRNVQ